LKLFIYNLSFIIIRQNTMPSELFSDKTSHKMYAELKTLKYINLALEEFNVDLSSDVDINVFEGKTAHFRREIKVELVNHCKKLFKLVETIRSEFEGYSIREELIINSLIILYTCVEYILILSKYDNFSVNSLLSISLIKMAKFEETILMPCYTDEQRRRIFKVFDRYMKASSMIIDNY
jgi:hypothetical protein